MKSITNLPEEILCKIVQDFDKQHLLRCQRLCREWYLPFHLLLLKDIYLVGAQNIKAFVTSIDSNPHPAYLNAVTKINFYNGNTGYYEDTNQNELKFFEKEDMFQGLFFRFPNLKDILFEGELWLLQHFSDRLCKKFLELCPKLNEFEVQYRQPFDQGFFAKDYFDSLLAARLLVTHFDINLLDSAFNSYQHMVDYIAKFPRLQDLDNTHNIFGNFREWRPVLEKIPNFRGMYICLDDQENFMSRYLSSLSNTEKEQFIERLAQIRELTCVANTLPVNALQTCCKYLTGLHSFYMRISHCSNWHDLQMFKDVFNLLASSKTGGVIYLQELAVEFLSQYFTEIVCKMFDDLPGDSQRNIKENYFKLNIESENGTQNAVNTLLNRTLNEKDRRLINVRTRKGLNLHEIIPSLFTTQLNNVDTFELQLANKYDKPATVLDVNIYAKILSKMPSLKKVILDIPASFEESTTIMEGNFETIHYQVEDVTIQANEIVKFQTLLDSFSFIFPNIKQLEIYYFSGVFKPDIGVFDLVLPKYSLKQLTLDLTPVKNKMLALKVSNGSYFFLIDVESINDRQLLQVPLDLSSITQINQDDIDELLGGENYYRIQITVKKLKRLQIFVDYNSYSKEEHANYQENEKCMRGNAKTRLIRLDYTE